MRDVITTALLSLAACAGCGGDDDGAQSAGAIPNGAAGAGAAATCQQIYDNAERQCPGGGFPLVSQCEDTREFESTGCAAWPAWMSCAGTGTFTCDGLFVDCEAHWQAARQCRAALAGTGCVRVVSSDDGCAEATPYAFSCFGSPPRPDSRAEFRRRVRRTGWASI